MFRPRDSAPRAKELPSPTSHSNRVSSNRRLRCRRCVGLHQKCRQFLPVLAPSGTDMLGVFGDSDGDTPISSSKTCPLSHCWRLTLRRPTSRRL